MLKNHLFVLYSIMNRSLFLFRNLLISWRLPVISGKYEKNYAIKGIDNSVLESALELFRTINGNANYDAFMYLLYKVAGKKYGFVIENNKHEIIGVELYYVNKRDLKDNTVHQAFRGIREDCRGQGLGTELTRYALGHFERTPVNGVSSRVSLNNRPSLTSNLRLGFEIVETYYEQRAESREQRAYLIKRFVSRE